MEPLGLDIKTLNDLFVKYDDRQLLWLSGYLYGLSVGKNAPHGLSDNVGAGLAPTLSNGVADRLPNVTILYGSQTGNAKKAAQKTAEQLKSKGFEVNVVDMAEYPTKKLKDEKLLFVIVSTYGEGEPPAAAEELHKFIFSTRAPKLPELKFAVLALGDSSYVEFCKTGLDFDTKLEILGAKRLTNRIDCDVDWHDVADEWIEAVVKSVDVYKNNQSSNGHAAIFITNGAVKVEEKISKYDRKNPFAAEILEKIQLNGRGSAKETWHVEFSLADSGLIYQPGDALHIIPKNSERLVSEVLKASKLDPTTTVEWESSKSTLGEILLNKIELSVVTRDVLQKYQTLSNNENLKTILSDTKKLHEYIYGRDIVDVLNEFPTALTAQTLLSVLKKLPSRAYSIASSLVAHPDEVHLTVAAVHYEKYGRKKQGVASTFLSDRVNIGESVNVFLENNEFFKLPKDNNTDILMVGPGTGIAPFRAFVEERAEMGAAGKNWLVFGNPNFTSDFLYQTEWQQYLKKGVLTRLDLAFSRDQAEKIYVQHRLLQKSKQVWEWINNGTTLYVCGDKNKMASDVERSFIQIAQKEGGLTEEKAIEFIKNLKKTRKYLEDVY